jgi:hypothetical protein
MLLPPSTALRHRRHSLSEPAFIVRTGIHCQNRHSSSEPALCIRVRREIEEAEERQNRAEREMQANISRREKQGAIRQGWAKIRAEAEKEKLHRLAIAWTSRASDSCSWIISMVTA